MLVQIYPPQVRLGSQHILSGVYIQAGRKRRAHIKIRRLSHRGKKPGARAEQYILQHPTNSIRGIPGAGEDRPLRYSFLVVGTAREGEKQRTFQTWFVLVKKNNPGNLSPSRKVQHKRQLRPSTTATTFFVFQLLHRQRPVRSCVLAKVFLTSDVEEGKGRRGEAKRRWTWSTGRESEKGTPRKANEGPNEGPIANEGPHGQIEGVKKKLGTSKKPCFLSPDRPDGDDAPAKMDAKWS